MLAGGGEEAWEESAGLFFVLEVGGAVEFGEVGFFVGDLEGDAGEVEGESGEGEG
ncbi:MAG: hypothetical protein RI897_1386 [Verrucomicrobiota bacterium]